MPPKEEELEDFYEREWRNAKKLDYWAKANK